jgi:hypothetical protein
MCTPDFGIAEGLALAGLASTAATTAVSIGQAGAQYSGQQRQAEAQEQQNAVQRQFNDAAMVSKTTQGQSQEALVNQEAYGKLAENASAARAAQSTAATAAGEAGVSGLSVDALQREYMSRAGQFSSEVEANRTASVDRLQLQLQGFQVADNAANARLPIPDFPSGMDTALRIGGALASGAAKGFDAFSKLPSSSGTSSTGNGLSISSGYRRAEQESYD